MYRQITSMYVNETNFKLEYIYLYSKMSLKMKLKQN